MIIKHAWRGTKRMQVSSTGTVEESCVSLPFGDSLNCFGTDANTQHFTLSKPKTRFRILNGCSTFARTRDLLRFFFNFMQPDCGFATCAEIP